jgi:glucosamine--fructose-6-phosphate aminotransferase (isomerizing)
MCGVFGYIGQRDAIKICLEGLEQLEYRGYDSTGIAGIKEGAVVLCKRAGKLSSLKEHLSLSRLELAIAHTRWATHGEVNDRNAHPHVDASGSLAIVHNGIIENYDALRHQLRSEGLSFASETDTEVIANLIMKYYQGDLIEAIHKMLPCLKGIFAFVAIHKDHPEEIIAVAKECPLSIAVDGKKTEAIISSDANCFFGLDLSVLFLHSNEMARVKKGNVEIFDSQLQLIHKEMQYLKSHIKPPSKETFDHFMLKEIFEQPSLIEKTLLHRLACEHYFKEIENPSSFFKNINKVWILGCGTSAHAGWMGALLLEDLAHLSASYEIASEARYRNPLLSSETLIIAISQSGETADTLAALRETKKYGCKTLGICNVKNSALTRETDHCLLLHADPEISVCSTKAFTSQLIILMLLTLYLGKLRNILSQERVDGFLAEMKKIPSQIQQILGQRQEIEALAKKYAQYNDFFFMGRRYMLPTCMEGALKLKEISYANANGYPAGELKHGPIALLDAQFPVIAFCANGQTREKILSNLMEVKARKAPALALASKDFIEIKNIADDVFWLPSAIDELAPFPSTVASQLFAYFIAKQKGCDIDQPRNLAKSVTVE